MKALSITHQHALAVITAEASRFAPGSTIRVLDAGCGNGSMIEYLQTMLPQVCPEYSWELYGYDVADHGVQENPDFISAAVAGLGQALPAVEWRQRIQTISTSELWPYKDGAFHVVVSNQVLEHVNDPRHFFSEIRRCLREDGFSAHIFPVKSQLQETHIHVPLAHWIVNHDLLVSWIKFWNRVGLGRFKTYNQPGDSLGAFAAKEADRLTYYCRYMKAHEFLRMCKDAQLRPSFRYTRSMYWAKVRSVLRMKPRLVYASKRSYALDWAAFHLLKFCAGITLFLDKSNAVAIKYTDFARSTASRSSLQHE